MSHRRIAAAALGVAALAALALPPSRAADEVKDDADVFAKKIVYVEPRHGGDATALEKARVRKLLGSNYIVGNVVPAFDDEWAAGRKAWIAMDTVAKLIEFDSVDELKKALKDAPDAKGVAQAPKPER